ncbi:MAG: 3-isopropylmalate dehydrogenase, partial [Propionibacteriaceae bacterium]|nr:3-isopropylmalate dehydrogenase [Propionibacteriaceae bacterium]
MPTGLNSFKIGVIAGDGIGPEVTAEAVKVLKAMTSVLEFTDFDLGASHWQATGEVLNDDTLAKLDSQDAILLGAVGAAPGSTQIPSGLLERGLLLKIRFAFDQGLNIRPNVLYPGVTTPLAPAIVDRGPIDFVVVREGTEGPYAGVGGVLRSGTPHEVATEVSLNTAMAVERCVRDAFRRASERRKHVTLLHKHNVLTNAGGLWRRIFDGVGSADFPGIERDYLHIDAATIAMVQDPQRFDVIVTDNLFGDIITDLAAAVTGGIGLAAS